MLPSERSHYGCTLNPGDCAKSGLDLASYAENLVARRLLAEHRLQLVNLALTRRGISQAGTTSSLALTADGVHRGVGPAPAEQLMGAMSYQRVTSARRMVKTVPLANPTAGADLYGLTLTQNAQERYVFDPHL